MNPRKTTTIGIAMLLVLAGALGACDQGADEAQIDETWTEPVEDPLDEEGLEPEEEIEEAECVSTKSMFTQRVWAPILSKKCMMCHNAQGAAKDTKLVLMSPAITGFLDMNYQTVQDVAAYQHNGESILLLKPTARIDHVGGEVVDLESAEYADLEAFVTQLADPIECEDQVVDDGSFFAQVDMLDAAATWNKATLQIAGRRPTASETSFLNVAGESALEQLIDALLLEEGYVRWVKETYGDLLLTDRYLPGDDAIGLLSMDDYPDAYWFSEDYMGEYASDPTLRAMAGGGNTNRAVARQALELIAHVVRSGLPFSDIISAPYTMVNPYSQITFSAIIIDGGQFEDPYDPAAFLPAVIPGVPHAGVLTTPVFLSRFPTTDTNRNRHRARMVFDFFLATDVLKLAERPVDPTAIEDHNPTMFNPQCTVCHGTIDPVAGAFQNWSSGGRYLPPDEGWYPDMVTPGFGNATIPANEKSKAVRWLADEIAGDTRFTTAALHIAFTGLTGQEPLRMPVDEDGTMADYEERLRAFEVQDGLFESLTQAYVDAGEDHRVLVRGLLLSPWFRSSVPRTELSEAETVELKDVGTARLLTPELLDRKITTVTGRRWASGNSTPYLLDEGQLMVFFGGINSDDITRRITTPNGLMASVVQRMATEVACSSAAPDFVRPRVERRLFPYVDHTYGPEDINGFEVEGAIEAIYENIRFLHGWLLGEWLPGGHEDIEATYALFYDTWLEGRAAVDSGEVMANLANACRATKDEATGANLSESDRIIDDSEYIVRAWQAVLTYLMSDYRFIYE
jgi:hypothetical protein